MKIQFLGIIALSMMFLQAATMMAQVDTTIKEFYPLELGNLWQYRDQNNKLYTLQVAISDTLMEDSFHYAAVGVPPNFSTGYDFLMIDTSLQVRYFGDTCSVYHLNESVGSYWKICHDITATLCRPWFMRFDGIFIQTIFGRSREVMRFTPGAYCSDTGDTVWYFVDWLLVRGIGVYRTETVENTYMYLGGAIINGVTFGTVVGVEDSPSTLPTSFVLEQNYPNPFNPTTTIEYQLPEEAHVILRIYDVLGREIGELVNEQQMAGRYQKDFDASKLASGIYVYKLNVGKYFQARSMSLIK